jgi:excisionase family DNA binding protein
MREFARELVYTQARNTRLRERLRGGSVAGVEDDTYTTGEAARILRVTESRVRQMLKDGELEGSHDVNKRWRIPQRAVHARMDARPREPRESRGAAVDVGELIERLAQAEHARGQAEARLQLTEYAESTMREQLERERERADRLESELAQMRGRGFWARLFGG